MHLFPFDTLTEEATQHTAWRLLSNFCPCWFEQPRISVETIG